MERMLECEDIQWFVDLIGTDVILRKIISTLNPKMRDFQVITHIKDFLEEKGHSVTRVTKAMVERVYNEYKVRGIIYSGAHWYALRNDRKTDSYSLDYQIKGTAHFCQLFSTVIFTGIDNQVLQEGEYADNIRVVMRMLRNIITSKKRFTALLLKELKDLHYEYEAKKKCTIVKGMTRYGKPLHLEDMKKTNLLQFIQQIINSADNLQGCK